MELKRIKALASLVDSNKVFDVGCDHALLAIYLSSDHEVVASDISESSIVKAKQNIEDSKANVKLLLSDGLDNLNINNEDNIVIAGMGTHTILKILNKNLSKLSNTIIIQSNNNHEVLRREMVKLGYYIDIEKNLFMNRCYVMIRFKKGYHKYKYIDYILGPNPSKQYIEYTLNRYDNMIKEIPFKYIIKIIKVNYIRKLIKRRYKELY